MAINVLVVSLLRQYGPTGVQSHMQQVRTYLRGQGVPCEIVTPFSAPKLLFYPFMVLRILLAPISPAAAVWWYRFWHGRALRFAIRRKLPIGAPLIICAQCPVSAEIARRARRSLEQKIVLTVHFNISQADEWRDKGMIRDGDWLYRRIRLFEARVLPSVDAIVYVSKFMYETIRSTIPAVQAVPHALVPNFVASGMAGRAPVSKFDLVSIGTLEPRKNQAYLIEIVAQLRRNGRNISLAIIGDGPEMARLQQLAVSLNVSDSVRLLGFRKDAVQHLRVSRAYIHSATLENLPLSIIEAMAVGLPIFAPQVGGIPEMLNDGINGRFIPLEDASMAADIVLGTLDDPDRYARMAAASRRIYADRYSGDIVAANLHAFLHRIAQPVIMAHRGAAAIGKASTGFR
ncbi:MAG: glycosyltransferase family 4 protein [Steroidobacteraceae bacterium]